MASTNQVERLLVQVVERRTLKGLMPIQEVCLERREGESDVELELRCRRMAVDQVRQGQRFSKVTYSVLDGRDWAIDCVLL